MSAQEQVIKKTLSLDPKNLKVVPAKIVIENNQVFLLRDCHPQKQIIEHDAEFYKSRENYRKPVPKIITQTKTEHGCPYDCGLCPHHCQHTCIGLIDITNKCNMPCKVCYANSGKGDFLDLKTIERMLDFYQKVEFNKAEILQISGGEPTLHPQIIDIIKLAKSKGIKYIMINTNGIRLAQDEAFVKELQQFDIGFEVYLQFDGLEPETFIHFRGSNYLDMKLTALKHLQKYNIPTTLVATIQTGINDDQLGRLILFGLQHPIIRGINFQPVTFFGRIKRTPEWITNRATQTRIIQLIEKQMSGMIQKADFVPLPCSPDLVAVTFLFKQNGAFTPVTQKLSIDKYAKLVDNTLAFDLDSIATGTCCSGGGCCDDLTSKILKYLPKDFTNLSKQQKKNFVTDHIFRITVTTFLDAFNFDVNVVKTECVHFITPDLKRIPFSTYNLIYRERYLKEKIKAARLVNENIPRERITAKEAISGRRIQ